MESINLSNNLETIDLGGNRLTEVPKALMFFLKNLC